MFSLKINALYSQVLIPNKINYPNSKDYVAVKASGASNTQDSSLLAKMKQLVSGKAQSAADPQTNSINIKPGEIKNIGSIDGSPLNVSFDADGMALTSFSMTITDKEPIDSPRNKLATEVYFSYSPAQQEKASLIANEFRLLYSVANGSISVNQYNETDLGSTSELLTSLGIDVSKSFSFNGKSFSLDAQDNLHAVLPASSFNITQ